MPLTELRKALLAAVDLIPIEGTGEPEVEGDYTQENSDGTGQITETDGSAEANGTQESTLAQPDNQSVDTANTEMEGSISDVTNITSDAMRYEELSQRISVHESEIKELTANVANLLAEVGRIKGSLTSVADVVDNGVIVPRSVRSLEDSIRRI